MPDDASAAERLEQFLSEGDQSTADADQTIADLDQSTSEADQSASTRDQLASDRDQRAADRDQAASDRARDQGAADPGTYTRSRRTRAQTTLERDVITHARSDTARIRDAAAEDRDRTANSRDAAADARDALAAALEAEIEHLDGNRPAGENGPSLGMEILLRAAEDRKRAQAGRVRAAANRAEAALDRDLGRNDRDRAAADRRAAADELAAVGIDHLTGALRRRVGLVAIGRELERVRRSGEPLIVAFVDVDGLKAVNDSQGHAAGDEILREVVATIQSGLRAYDVILRYGGDEFVCSLAGQGIAGVRTRFDQISMHITQTNPRAAISVGFAESGSDDSVGALLVRADHEMIALRRSR
ncbi:MAG: hypothetical protein QOE86_2267 [Solirubrobacteraceae bacterium]|nr:hypothetical protein [Solirubrobacteraceae bacterium]